MSAKDSEFEMSTSDEIEFVVFDVPLLPEERRHFVFMRRLRWYVVLRIAQSSGNAPITNGRQMAQCARAALSTAPPGRMRIETDVDDTLVVMRGTHNERRTTCVRVICVWLELLFSIDDPDKATKNCC